MRTALQDAVSIGSLIIVTESLIGDPAKEGEPCFTPSGSGGDFWRRSGERDAFEASALAVH